jgi:hypothetical protein
MVTEELKENIKKHYGSSDEDLRDLGEVMDALSGVDELENLKRDLETAKIKADEALKKLDEEWRNRYRERFFDGDVTVPVVEDFDDVETETDDVTIEDYIEEIKKEKF